VFRIVVASVFLALNSVGCGGVDDGTASSGSSHHPGIEGGSVDAPGSHDGYVQAEDAHLPTFDGTRPGADGGSLKPPDAGGAMDENSIPCGIACPSSTFCLVYVVADGGLAPDGCNDVNSSFATCTQTAAGWTSPYCGVAPTTRCGFNKNGSPSYVECGAE